jgi:pimeloyl-ACP methyl ester carboxylesterase
VPEVIVDGLRLNYQTLGEGPDVLLIHGWVSSWRMWARSMSRLATAGYRATAIDLIGFGDSDKPADGWYTLNNYTTMLLAACRELGLTRPALVGHSMGGTIALSLALHQPTGALLVAAPMVTGELSFSLHLLLTSPAARRMLGWMKRQGFFSLIGDLRPMAAPGLMRDPVRRRNQEDLQRTTLNAAVGSLRTVVGSSLEDQLEKIEAPTVILIGGRDYTVAPSQGRLAARRIPNSRLVEWPEVGHSIVDDRGDAFDTLLIDHLNEALTPARLNSPVRPFRWPFPSADQAGYA